MSRVIVVIAMVVIVLTMSAGLAVAGQAWELICTDNPGGPLGQDYELWYIDPTSGGPTWTTEAYAFLFAAGNPATTTVDPSITFAITNDMMVMDVTDNQDNLDGTLHISGFDIFTPPNTIAAPTLIASITTSAPTQLWWETGNPLFEINNNGSNYNGSEMNGNGWLIPEPPAGELPVPEIITIVLVSLGLIALGGYIWYRKHNMAQIAA